MTTRIAGTLESMFARISTVVSTNFAVVVHLSGQLEIPRLEAAIRATVRQLSAARSSLLPSRSHHFELLTRDDWEGNVLKTIHAGEWLETLDDELNTHVSGPIGVRATLVTGRASQSSLVLVFNHALFDGHSGVLFLRETLENYANDEPGGRPSAALPYRSLEEFVGEATPVRPLRLRDWLRIFWMTLLSLLDQISVPAPGKIALKRTRILSTTLGADETSRLRDGARARGTSVNDLLCAAMLRVSNRILPLKRRSLLGCVSLVNLRGYYRHAAGAEVIGALISFQDSRIPARLASDPHHVLRAVQRQNHLSQAHQTPRVLSRMMSLLGPPSSIASHLRAASRFSRYTTYVTNLGHLEKLGLEKRYGNVQLDDAFFVPTAGFTWAGSLGLAASSFDERLTLSLLESADGPRRVEEGMVALLEELRLFAEDKNQEGT